MHKDILIVVCVGGSKDSTVLLLEAGSFRTGWVVTEHYRAISSHT